jgi:hypothetical protein
VDDVLIYHVAGNLSLDAPVPMESLAVGIKTEFSPAVVDVDGEVVNLPLDLFRDEEFVVEAVAIGRDGIG